MNEEKGIFFRAKPVFAEGMTRRINTNLIFRGKFILRDTVNLLLKITASNLFKVYINGNFIAYGPARATKNYYRVDRIEISEYCRQGENQLVILCTNSYVPCFHMVCVPGFVQAEICSDDRVVFATDKNSILCYDMDYREREVLRVNCQRTFVESYFLRPEYFETVACPLPIEEVEARNLLEREVGMPDYSIVDDFFGIRKGTFHIDKDFVNFYEIEVEPNLPPELIRFTQLEKGWNTSKLLQQIVNDTELSGDLQLLQGRQYAIFDFSQNLSGFLGFRVKCKKKAHLVVVFDELLLNDDLRHGRCVSQNFMEFHLDEGSYSFESMEVNTFRYLRLNCFEGEIEITNLYVRQYRGNESGKAKFHCSDEDLNRLFIAAKETFDQNAVDIFTDCPGRERGGWLCDSYFTGKAEKVLTGSNRIEKEFLMNFARYNYDQAYVPFGMIPSVYPSDSFGEENAYIPNWAMFFVLELEEYAKRNSDNETVEALREKVLNLANYFCAYENKDGLLENLPGWVFLEWSKASDYVEGINYPTNMLYCRMLFAISVLYGLKEYEEKATILWQKIIEKSFKGGYFHDRSVCVADRFVLTDEISEACQYYAILFLKLKDDKEFSPYIEKILELFRGNKKVSGVDEAAVFIGKYLRMQLLSLLDRTEEILEECKILFLPMMRRTGTLWENKNERGSCCHGFASVLAALFYWNLLGVEVDTVMHRVKIHAVKTNLGKIKAEIPVPQGLIEAEAEITQKNVQYKLGLPQGYTLDSDLPENVQVILLEKN